MSSTLERFDRQLLELQRLKFEKRECPGCHGLLETPTPLKPMVCPVCRSGKLAQRKTDEKWCPICRSGALKVLRNASPIRLCPLCGTGRLKAGGLLGKRMRCGSCQAEFGKNGSHLTLTSLGKSKRKDVDIGASGDSDAFWLPFSGRSSRVTFCETCRAQWDEREDGSMHLAHWEDDPFGVARKYGTLSKAEWAKVGLRLKPESGNTTCTRCDADFWMENGEIVPLHADHDPYGFVSEFHGCRLELESVRYLGVYKISGNPGSVCSECRTEFDLEGDYFRLRATNRESLAAFVEQARPMEDWHRLSRGLPAIDEEAAWRESFDAALRRALVTGEVSWADKRKQELIWRSDAERLDPASRGRLLLTPESVEFQCRKHGWAVPRDTVRGVEVEEDIVTLDVVGQPEAIRMRVLPETVAIDLKSGRREVVLDAADFADALASC